MNDNKPIKPKVVKPKPINIEEVQRSKLNVIKSVQLGSEEIEIPEFQERLDPTGFVKYGKKNDYPFYLRSLSNKCARHSSILKTKANMIGGNGFTKTNLSPQTISFLKNQNGKLNCDQILARTAHDFIEIGAFAIKVTWDKGGKKIAKLDYINVDKLRMLPAGSDPEYPQRVYWLYCEDWMAKKDRPEIIAYPAFDEFDREEAEAILYVKQAQGSGDYYGVPSWISVAGWCEIDYQLMQWHLNNITGGMTPNLIINFNTLPPDEEQDDVVRRTDEQYNGVKGKKTIYTFSDGAANAPVITTINPNTNDSSFVDLTDAIETNVFMGHQVTNPALFGCFQDGKLDNTSNLIESLSIFQSMVIDHLQKVLAMEFNKLAEINGITDNIMIERYNLNLEVQLSIPDLLLVLQATIIDAQKVAIFESVGYTREQALTLVPPGTPTPVAPIQMPKNKA